MVFNIKKETVKDANVFAAGLALGTLGLRVLTSKDARKVYSHVVAAGMRAKESVMGTVDRVQASTDDIVAEAKEINAARDEALFDDKTSTEGK